MKHRVTRLLFLALAGVTLLAPFAPESAFAADQKPPAQHVSSKLVAPLKAAQEAMQKQDWDTAIAKTLEAKAVPDQTPYDKYQIAEFLSFLYLKKEDYANAAGAFRPGGGASAGVPGVGKAVAAAMTARKRRDRLA